MTRFTARLQTPQEIEAEMEQNKVKEYTCVVKIEYGGNNHEAENKEDYIKKVKTQFHEEFGIHLVDTEISEITLEED